MQQLGQNAGCGELATPVSHDIVRPHLKLLSDKSLNYSPVLPHRHDPTRLQFN